MISSTSSTGDTIPSISMLPAIAQANFDAPQPASLYALIFANCPTCSCPAQRRLIAFYGRCAACWRRA